MQRRVWKEAINAAVNEEFLLCSSTKQTALHFSYKHQAIRYQHKYSTKSYII